MDWPFLVFDEDGELDSICLLPREEDWDEHKVSLNLEANPELLNRIEQGLILVKREYSFVGGRIDLLCVTVEELEPVMIELKNWSTGKWARFAYQELERYLYRWNATRSSEARGYLVIPVIKWFQEYPAEYGFLWNILAHLGFDPFWALERTHKGPFSRSKDWKSVWTKGIFDDFLSQYHFRYLEARSDEKRHRTFLYASLENNPITQRFVREEFERESNRVFIEESMDYPTLKSQEKAIKVLEDSKLLVQLTETFSYVNNSEESLSKTLELNKKIELLETTDEIMTEVQMLLSRLKAIETKLSVLKQKV